MKFNNIASTSYSGWIFICGSVLGLSLCGCNQQVSIAETITNDKPVGQNTQSGENKQVIMPRDYSSKSDQELRSLLTPEQYRVAKEEGTERPFNNTYWDNKRQGIYVDVISGAPLFSSLDKFDSGTGWPSFTQPLEKEEIVEKKDIGFGMIRTEARSKKGDAHLGHIFKDGPAPTGLRYCINSASLRFIAVEDLENEGYSQYRELFEANKKVSE